MDLDCRVWNWRAVDADKPKAGDKVTMLLEYRGHDPKSKSITMTGVYVGKAP